jgi:Ca2+-binding RTX toxin-like protein
MATIRIGSDFDFNLIDIDFSNIYNAFDYERTSKRFDAIYEIDSFETFRGSGFKYKADGTPVAGKVKSYEVVVSGDFYLKVSGLSVPASKIVAAANTESIADDVALIKKALKGNDRFFGSGGDESVKTYAGNDRLFGADGNDILDGGKGNDVIDGGLGKDALIGGTGKDTFVFSSVPSRDFVDDGDRIVDFRAGTDKIGLTGFIFGIAPSQLANAISLTGVAIDSDDRIIYNQSQGSLAYDPDGAGGEAAIIFASLRAGTPLGVQDFVIV